MNRATAVLIAAASGRALAASARRGGYAPLVADFFGDEDTVAAAEAHIRLDQGLARGMRSDTVIAALESLAALARAGRNRLRHRVRGSAGPARRHRAALDPVWQRTRRGRARERSAHFCKTLPGLRRRASRYLPQPPAGSGKLAREAPRRRRRPTHPARGRRRLRRRDLLLPAPRRWRPDVRNFPRRRSSRHDPRFQHAMVGARQRASHSATAAPRSPPRSTPRPPTR